LKADTKGESPTSQLKLLSEVEALVQKEDLLLVKILVTNEPIVEVEYGKELVSQAIDELVVSLQALNSTEVVERVSNVLFAIRAKYESNPLGLLRQITELVSDVNTSGRYRFLLEVAVGAVVTDHTLKLGAQDWLSRLNLVLMKSARSGKPEIVDSGVALAEQVRNLLSRIGPGSPPPKGMYWVFQPVNYVETGEIFGFEALCRWDVPKLGSISPEIFIQVAEELNLVQIIDFWTLKAVESAYPALRKHGGSSISVNVSAQTIGNDHNFFFSAIDLLLPKLKEAHFSLTVELTETSVIENQIDLSLGLSGLRQRGAKIAIDDFGTGKTSLSVISSLPTDFVKLDGSLLQVERPDLSRGLLELGVKFADLVGAEVIVEKVETQADLDLAKAVGAKFAQGWLFGKPVDVRPAKSKTRAKPKAKPKS
jgi:EAL domain-containing protein (putative c-di-GMP-specific phosphodiesterase class I)